MTTRKNPTDPDKPNAAAAGDVADKDQAAEPGSTPSVRMVYVQDTNTKQKLPHPVPESWLRRFNNLKQVPSDKAATDTQKGGN